MSPPPSYPLFSANPTVQEIFRARVFGEPLVPLEGEPRDADNSALVTALNAYLAKGGMENTEPLEAFLAENAESPWRMALLANLGAVYARTHRYTRAEKALREAWELGREAPSENARALAEHAFSQLLQIEMNFGRVENLEELLRPTMGREFLGSAQEWVTMAHWSIWGLRNRHQEAIPSGPVALDRILDHLGMARGTEEQASIEADSADEEAPPVAYLKHPKLATFHATPDGATLQEMAKLAKEVGLGMKPAFREAAAEIPVPSMMHFRGNHFAALLAKTKTHVRLDDPIFGGEIWMSLKAFEEEASGYFLVRESMQAGGWRDATPLETAQVRGKCKYPYTDPEGTRPNDPAAGGDDDDPEEDEPGSEDPPDENETPPGSNPPPPQDCVCPPCTGMARYSFNALRAGVTIRDSPLSYRPPVGPRVDFRIRYSQLEATQPAIMTYSNIGRRWSHNWMSYIEDDPGNPAAAVKLAVGGGGRETYSGYDGSAYGAHWQSRAIVVRTATSPIRYERRFPGGSVEVFAQADGAATSPRRVYLTEFRTPQGNKVDLAYDAQMRLVSLTDAIGQVSTFSYEMASDPLKLTKFTDPFGRSTVLQYSVEGRLIRVTDPVGITSSFEYGGSDDVRALTTPYGTTMFRFAAETTTLGYEPRRWAEAVDVSGAVQRIEFAQGVTSQPATEPAPPGFGAANLHQRSSYSWSRRNTPSAGVGGAVPDYAKAQAIRWSQLNTYAIGSAPLSRKAAGRKRVYSRHNSAGIPSGINATGKPDAVGRVLSDGSSRIDLYERTPIGRTTHHTDPVGRETIYEYDTNGIDLLQVKRVKPGGHDLLATYTWNAFHRPLTYTDASGRVWTFTWNSRQQIATITTPPRAGITENRTTTFTYDSSSYLTSVTGPATGATVSYTYDSKGRPRTLTDADSYTLTLDYDDLNRPTKVTYPDATYEETQYERLYARAFRDRKGRWTHVFRDARGLVTGTQDTNGRTTIQQRCSCGSIDKLTDARGNSTEWQRDVDGRVIKEIRANGSFTEVSYDANTGWVTQVKDPLNQLTKFEHFADGSLKRVFYQDAVISTPQVSFTYDTLYPRVSTMTDGIGTTTFAYHPVSTSQLGSARLASLDGPYSSDTLSYTYDELGRMATRTYGGATTTWSRDVLGRLTTQAESIGNFGFGYVGVTGRLQQLTYANGQVSDYAYLGNTQDKRLSEIHHRQSSGGATLSRFNYTYDLLGNITSWQQQYESDTKVWEYGYDPADQLTLAVHKTTGGSPTILKRFSYGYDLAGNRTGLQDDDLATSASFDTMNRLLSTQAGGALRIAGTLNEPGTVTVQGQPAEVLADNRFQASTPIGTGTTSVTVLAQDPSGNTRTNVYDVSASGGSTSYSYDANGNLSSDGTKTFEWDAADRLVAVKQGGTTLASFTYDGFGRRAQKVAGGVTRTYVYAGTDIIEERPSSGSNIRYFHGPGIDQPFARQVSGVVTYYLADHLGSIVQETNASAALMLTRKYDPWGNMTSGSTTAGYAYTGREWDPETSLYYYRARYFDPKIGRFISEDPIGFGGGINKYAYADGNPVAVIDPLGNDGIRVTYPNFRVDIGDGRTAELGHGAVIAVDPKTGTTKYYEYGRYETPFGEVKGPPDRKVPDLEIGKDGKPTQASLDRLYEYISKKYGQDGPVEAEYWENADYQKMIDFAERRKNDPNRRPYSWNPFRPNHCLSFRDEVIRAGMK